MFDRSTPWKLSTALAAFVACLTAARLGYADSPSPSLPQGCSSGEIVVSRGSNQFACVSPRTALGLDSCNAEDFVVADSSGRFTCVRPSTSSWGIEGLLPDCSSGYGLVSEGFGKWRCVDPMR